MLLYTDSVDINDGFQWKVETNPCESCKLSVIDKVGHEVVALSNIPAGKLKQLIDVLVVALGEPAPKIGWKVFTSPKFEGNKDVKNN